MIGSPAHLILAQIHEFKKPRNQKPEPYLQVLTTIHAGKYKISRAFSPEIKPV